MEMSVGELVDRLSIATLKCLKIGQECEPERNTLFRELPAEFLYDFASMLGINEQIWYYEAAIRHGKEGSMTLDDVGRRALMIRDWNAKRVALKNKINEKAGSGFPEIKKDHASEAA
jgi:hypothetical protein